ncbi:Rha family transcriptional regulator [Acinetobacter sp. YH12099]|uniref:Rha family transcriptional regulator n=1 Tax=Acinetobacter sp. YH12099 TaxID=2601088 RepID=UPI0015D1182D|nr:Rha family transcriptional regulator [Acinetobacter sp. YH12099]
MNILAQFAENKKTMSSREIAELCEKQHKHVCRDIEVMFDALNLNSEGYAQNWTHPQNGQTYTEYLLDENLTMTLVTGYSVVLRHRVVSRWKQLELSTQQNTIAISSQEFNQLKNQVEQMQYQVALLTRKGKQKVQITDDNVIESKIKQDILRMVHANPARGVTLNELKKNSRAVQRDLEIAERIINQLIDLEEIKLVLIPSPSGRGKPRNAYFVKGGR